MKFPQITWKTIKHTWIFCGYQNAVPNIHTKSIQFPCLVFQVLWIFQNPMINPKKFGVEKWLIFPVLSYAEFTGLHVVNLAKLSWGIFCFRGE